MSGMSCSGPDDNYPVHRGYPRSFFSMRGFDTLRTVRTVTALAALASVLAGRPGHAQPTELFPSITTSRGCLETGQDATFTVGDQIIVSFRIDSNTTQSAQATVLDALPNGLVNVLSLGSVSTNQPHAFTAMVGPPSGIETLKLRAQAIGVTTVSANCSFHVVGLTASTTTPTPRNTRTPTGTPRATRTPTPTSTPRPSITASPDLQPQISTNRGCFETGQNPVFRVGESILLSWRTDSPTFQQTRATIFDFLSNGFVNVFSLGTIPTNQTRTFFGRIAPPTGIERVQLRSQASTGETVFSKSCSFLVVGSATPSPSPTGIPPVLQTPTVTATPLPGLDLHPQISTNRGCFETGQNPTFILGDSILLRFRVDSQTFLGVQGTIFDFLPNGFVNVFGVGALPTNQDRALRGRVVPPTGVERVQLRARTASGATTTSGSCSFSVVERAPTRTPTRTPTARLTATATPSATPTATAMP